MSDEKPNIPLGAPLTDADGIGHLAFGNGPAMPVPVQFDTRSTTGSAGRSR